MNPEAWAVGGISNYELIHRFVLKQKEIQLVKEQQIYKVPYNETR